METTHPQNTNRDPLYIYRLSVNMNGLNWFTYRMWDVRRRPPYHLEYQTVEKTNYVIYKYSYWVLWLLFFFKSVSKNPQFCFRKSTNISVKDWERRWAAPTEWDLRNIPGIPSQLYSGSQAFSWSGGHVEFHPASLISHL